MMARLSTVFGLLALVLASIGIYGVLAYSVTRRTGEIAIRTSLGAMPREIARMILTDGMRPAAAGAVVGLGASFAATRFIATFLFGVAPVDLPTYGVATVFLLGVAALACYLPARRATKVDPMAALREE
jgi:ABC-type antimicrobial peptide transport system permease subunit